MSKRRTYVDANLLIVAWRGQDEAGVKAMAVLDDPGHSLVVNDAVWLEVMPKPWHHKQHLEREFYKNIFDRSEHVTWKADVLYQAHDFAQRYGIAAMDAIHVANAVAVAVDEFVSAEKPTKPMFQVEEIKIRSLREAGS